MTIARPCLVAALILALWPLGLTGCRKATLPIPTAPDLVAAAPAGSSSCAQSREYWKALMSDLTRFCASARESDLDLHSPIRLSTNSWFFVLPQLPERFPDSFMSFRLNPVSWKFTNECGTNGPEVAMKIEALFAVDVGGTHYPLWMMDADFGLNADPAFPFDPADPYEGMTRGSLGSTLNWRLQMTRIGIFEVEVVGRYMAFLPADMQLCSVRPPYDIGSAPLSSR